MSFSSDLPTPPRDVGDRQCGTVNQDAAHLAVGNLAAVGITTGRDDQTSLDFSNFARSAYDRCHTLAAPGVCMETNFPLPAHHTVGDGISFSAPVVSGVLALCIHTHRCGDSTPARNLRPRTT
ncbi:hypothetical protein [Streptomyces sp. NPDC059593]|uniref:hypothetical protein n=1 Tax=Streptomyces sp. NPDC059593 TaxID=3346878 RepID=UPI0036BDA3D5